MAHFTKATSVHDWLNQRLGIDTVRRVMATEYWIPKKYKLFVGNGYGLGYYFRSFISFRNFPIDVLSTKRQYGI